MSQNSRTKNTLLSTFSNIFEQLIAMAFGLVVPRLVIKTYGPEVNGLTSFIQQILNVFQLLQAGMIGAAIFELYKPIAEKAYDRINEIVNATTKFFYRVGSIFAFLVLMVIPFILYRETDSVFRQWEIICATVIMGLNGTLTFFFDARYDIIISSYQKRYIFSLSRIVNKCIYYILVILVILFKKHFVLMYVPSLVAKCVYLLILRFTYKKLTKDWYRPIREKINFKLKNRWYLLSNSIVFQLVTSLPYILISSQYDLTFTSVYSINYMIVNILKMLMLSFFHSVTEPFGNYNAMHTIKESSALFRKVQLGILFITTVLASCLICLNFSFIQIYTAKITDIQYAIPIFSFSLVFDFIFYTLYLQLNLVVDIFGLYKDIYRGVIVIGLVAIGVMSVLCKYCGIGYVPFAIAFFYLGLLIFYSLEICRKVKGFIKLTTLIAGVTILLTIVFCAKLVFALVPFAISNLSEWLIVAIAVFCVSVLISVFFYRLIFRTDFIILEKAIKNRLLHKR